jgi:hypothetical protein
VCHCRRYTDKYTAQLEESDLMEGRCCSIGSAVYGTSDITHALSEVLTTVPGLDAADEEVKQAV